MTSTVHSDSFTEAFKNPTLNILVQELLGNAGVRTLLFDSMIGRAVVYRRHMGSLDQ